jgi:hypothetical protein
MKTLREQTHIELDDLSHDFRFEAIRIWGDFGLDAARCFALGS